VMTVSGTTTVDKITVDATTIRGTVTTLGEAITPVTMMAVNANTKSPLSIIGRDNSYCFMLVALDVKRRSSRNPSEKAASSQRLAVTSS
jgi:hypothetical protein